MSDLVGNPNCLFSHAQAHMNRILSDSLVLSIQYQCLFDLLLNVPVNSYGHVRHFTGLLHNMPSMWVNQ